MSSESAQHAISSEGVLMVLTKYPNTRFSGSLCLTLLYAGFSVKLKKCKRDTCTHIFTFTHSCYFERNLKNEIEIIRKSSKHNDNVMYGILILNTYFSCSTDWNLYIPYYYYFFIFLYEVVCKSDCVGSISIRGRWELSPAIRKLGENSKTFVD